MGNVKGRHIVAHEYLQHPTTNTLRHALVLGRDGLRLLKVLGMNEGRCLWK